MNQRSSTPLKLLACAAAVMMAIQSSAGAAKAQSAAGGPECRGTVYLTMDTGNMSQAERIAAILKSQGVKATFFLANERTPNGQLPATARAS